MYITLGKSGKPENLLLIAAVLEKFGRRSIILLTGEEDITYHVPGQLVRAIPVLDLDHFFKDIHQYVRFFEEAAIATLEDYGLEAGRI